MTTKNSFQIALARELRGLRRVPRRVLKLVVNTAAWIAVALILLWVWDHV